MAEATNNLLRSLLWAVLACSLLIFSVAGGVLLAVIDSPQDLVKLRNSLLVEVARDDAFKWDPHQVPSSFLLEKSQPPQFFLSAVERVVGPESRVLSGWDNALSIARHIVQNRTSPAEPIQRDTKSTYRIITEEGRGYCADYTQVFSAMAISAGLSVREWGMSFDGYGGDGHAFSEVFDPISEKWMFIDSFYSFYVVNEQNIPVSVLELYDRLFEGDASSLEVVPIVPEKMSFKTPEKALGYYRRGMKSLFMTWGNNVFTYYSNASVQRAGSLSRSAEQLVAIFLGVHPRIMITTGRENAPGLRELERLRWMLAALSFAALFGTLAGGCLFWLNRRGGSR